MSLAHHMSIWSEFSRRGGEPGCGGVRIRLCCTSVIRTEQKNGRFGLDKVRFKKREKFSQQMERYMGGINSVVKVSNHWGVLKD